MPKTPRPHEPRDRAGRGGTEGDRVGRGAAEGDRERREFADRVSGSARRRIEARRRGASVLSWLGTFGIVGWSVAIPTVAGVAIGIWLDERYPTGFSWTLTMLVLGLAFGLVVAWGWVRREGREER